MTHKNPGDIEFGIIYGSIAIMALVAALYLPLTDMVPACVFRAVTGIPCPSCGVTRSLVHLAHGDIAGSLILNPVFSLVMLAVLFAFCARLVLLPFSRSRFMLITTPCEGTVLRVGMAVLFLANWIYIIFNR